MKNTGILLFLVGIFVIVNSGSFRDIVTGKASFGFLNPKNSTSSSQSSSSPKQTVSNASSGQVTTTKGGVGVA